MKLEDLVEGKKYKINKPEDIEASPTWNDCEDGMDYLDGYILTYSKSMLGVRGWLEIGSGTWFICPSWLTEVVEQLDEEPLNSTAVSEDDLSYHPSESDDCLVQDYCEMKQEEGTVLPEGFSSEVMDYELKLLKDAEHKATQKEWSDEHYSFLYKHPVTRGDSDVGFVEIKVDPYFVNKVWKLNSKEDSGGLFHNLKTIARFGDKNSVERELKALHAQIKRMAELNGVEL